jgi:predicted phage terminase large subunit-like protein
MNDLSADEVAELHALETAVGADSLIEFIPRVTVQWMPPWHLAPIAQLFARAEFAPVRACVSVPPRHGKTEMLLHAMSWWLGRHPHDWIAYTSYAGDLAHRKSTRGREIAKAAGMPSLGRASEWRSSIGRGGVLATGVGGPLTGEGANLLIVDDPIKNREEAESPTIRKKTEEWFTSTGLTRLEPGGSCIVVHTRWHDDDLIGRLTKHHGTPWETINLPAVREEPRAALWPERWPLKALKLKRKEVGEYDWWSLYMGQPQPRGGRLFGLPTFYGRFPDLENAYILIACDPATTSSTRADHSAIVVGAGKIGADGLPSVDLLEVHRLQVETPVLVAYLYEVQKRWGAAIGIEAVGGFKGVPQSLRALDRRLRIAEIHPTADKFVRALPAAAAWNTGRIRVPQGAQWLPDFLGEVQSFTGVGDAEDDQVDALAHLYNLFDQLLKSRKRGSRRAPGLPFG